ncbi:[acyl-carrier-protein] S-malonyltransferase [Streptomyces sp. CB01201]|uniref:ACP S-malonyltransferase n=1 Tax=Streptomyces sp. CB01201 TaxID=2020324 RepID=UPI000C27746C|nr:ACP S-malonyltransferase [Streptomyces sp. CB01201]PJN02053.1 [acyl-carrier-protein] S-malonyltransferase [Streptomyces sp. CB01201]
MRAWVFGGQGTQRKGMGEDLFARFPEHTATADRVLGESVAELCLRDPEGRLGRTRWTQPALFVVNALAQFAAREEGPAPDVLAGHSLGEYNALVAADCFDFETGLRLVKRRGELMAQADGGGMLAVLGLTIARVEALLRSTGVTDVDLANYNTATQVIVSGSAASIATVRTAVRAREGARCIPLATSGAFHSRHMAAAATEFAAFLAGMEFREPRIPVIANATARPYPPSGVARLLVDQITSRVRWHETMLHLIEQGVGELREFGPQHVLTPMWRAALAEPRAVDPPAGPAPLAAPVPAAPAPSAADPAAARLGSAEFRADFGLRYAYLAGSMFRGVASVELVARMGLSGLMGYLGAGGLPLSRVEEAVAQLARTPHLDGRYGVNVLHDMSDPGAEEALVSLLLRQGVRHIEAAAFTTVTPALVRFRFRGAHRGPDGAPVAVRTVLAKCSRPEVAQSFLSPPPQGVLARLVAEGGLSETEAAVARELPVAGDICVEADSAGHTDGGVSLALVPVMTALRDRLTARHSYPRRPRVGASGGLGTPQAVAAAFVLGADFVVTGSVNQCSPQAGTSDAVKDLLATLGVQDTTYAPAGDLFEMGSKVQVVRKGTLFAARANKLHQLYRQYPGLDALDAGTRRTLERDLFRAPLAQVWKQTREHYLETGRPHEVDRAESDPRHKMALVFKSYFARTNRAAQEGDPAERANYQIHCGPAAGAFNGFVRGTDLEPWRERHVDLIAERLMTGAAEVLRLRCAAYG